MLKRDKGAQAGAHRKYPLPQGQGVLGPPSVKVVPSGLVIRLPSGLPVHPTILMILLFKFKYFSIQNAYRYHKYTYF